ncbi:sulfatase family protein [Tautonia plasticadhaerens]|uniref:Arylsulfatase n=1 Tax=Tautonia plasticadhaerens TaxID=2527974 RepID=A0A518GV53_9BACT|nr:sulfatase [Tautonia plasticadhaerens]QDV32467.1 Arylsulfatase [Tautonia plasticadhaerens]
MTARLAPPMLLCLLLPTAAAAQGPGLGLPKLGDATPRNVVFILSDDHRFDAMGFMGHPFLETPNMDRLAAGGVHLANAFVTTSLCSPSRASILTGLYAHNHRVVDNNNPVPPGTVFFPQYLQAAGYETAFVGKWHMGGGSDDPRPGFDRWVSFRGQGSYLPGPDGLNVDGVRVPQRGYITDELTDYAVDWLEGRSGDTPFFLYLSHKGVHAEFEPAGRHKGAYDDAEFTPPDTMDPEFEGFRDRPMWVQNQRNSWHGVEFPYHSTLDVSEFYEDYCETLLGVDESIGRVLDTLDAMGVLDETVVIYMGDNGFGFGEHGLIDKRVAYEWSMRVPMLMHCPDLFSPGTRVEQVVANIDVAPTILQAAGLAAPDHFDGRSALGLAAGEDVEWRDSLLYEYYWERNFPHTPTIFALRTDQYKFVRPHGLWDLDELYDLRADPAETTNLVFSPEHQEVLRTLKGRLFDTLEGTGGMTVPIYADRGGSQNLRNADGSPAAEFPEPLLRRVPPDRERP